jgi:hypothetical protein
MGMLAELERKNVWEGWLSAEMRANYFADMAGRYRRLQKRLTWAILLASSGAAYSVIGSLPANLAWLKAALTLLAAGMSLFSLVQQYDRTATDCIDLHYRWNRLASEYESLWNNMYSDSAATILKSLSERSADVSKSSTTIPYRKGIMVKWQRHVQQHHAAA